MHLLFSVLTCPVMSDLFVHFPPRYKITKLLSAFSLSQVRFQENVSGV